MPNFHDALCKMRGMDIRLRLIMKRFSVDKKSIFFKMTRIVILLVIIQAVLLTGTMIAGGVLKQAQDNAYQSFYEKVQNRKDYIQREMKNKWTNLSPFTQKISRQLSEASDCDEFFRRSVDDLINMLRTTQTTGVFIILENSTASYPALYLRDYDPLLNDSGNKDLYLLLGPSDLAKEKKIPLDQYWKYNMAFTDSNRGFFEKPIKKAPLTFNASLLGYWNPPFLLFENDQPIITYTMPLFDADKKLRGIIGIEVSVNYFCQFLPSSDLQLKDSMGYLLGYNNGLDESIKPVLMTGALQKRMIHEDETLKLSEIDHNRDIYRIENHNSPDKVYANVERIGLYSYNTPFESEKWYLIGMMSENQLLSYVRKITQILWISFIASLLIGMAGGYFISYQLTKPIARLVKQVRESDRDKAMQLSPTGIKEIDVLSSAMEKSNNALLESTVRMSQIIELTNFPMGAFEIRNTSNHVYATDQLRQLLNLEPETMNELIKDKNIFLGQISTIMVRPEQEEKDVYRINGQEVKYLRFKIEENDSGTMGVVIDVTKEIMEKNRIKRERDYDPMTLIYNRKAVQKKIECALETVVSLGTAALIMFDLDNLKQVNDTYGHRWGDFYINRAVTHLSQIGEASSILGRRSGDEFVLFLYGFTDRKSVRKEIANFYEGLKLNPLNMPDGSAKAVTISGGLLWIEEGDLPYEEMLHMADELLYTAKKQRKGHVVEGNYQRSMQ